MLAVIKQCLCCSHYDDYINQAAEDMQDDRTQRCTAFPNGIPDEILTNKFNQRYEYKGDRGLRFKPLSDFYNSKQAFLMISGEMYERRPTSGEEIEEMMFKKHREYIDFIKNNNEDI